MDKELFFEKQNWFKNTGYGEVSFSKITFIQERRHNLGEIKLKMII
jgi:hypothetical protein